MSGERVTEIVAQRLYENRWGRRARKTWAECDALDRNPWMRMARVAIDAIKRTEPSSYIEHVTSTETEPDEPK